MTQKRAQMREERRLRSQARHRMLPQYTVAGAGAGSVIQADRSWLIMVVLATTCDLLDLTPPAPTPKAVSTKRVISGLWLRDSKLSRSERKRTRNEPDFLFFFFFFLRADVL